MAPTMRAAQYDKKAGRVLVRSVAVPEPKEDEFQIQIVAASLCHSDLMTQLIPKDACLTIGHEACGTISKIHPSAEGKGFKVGDKVGFMGNADNCFECAGCQLHASYCTNPKNGRSKINGLECDGFFAEYAVIDWRNAIHVPDGLPMEKASPLFCAGITAFHAVDKGELQLGQWLAIVGYGGLGQLATRYAKAMGLKVVCLDIDDRKLEMAKRDGADATFNPKNKQFAKDIRKLTGRRGVDAAAVFSDSQAAYATAQRVLDFNGALIVVGLPSTPLQFHPFNISLSLFRIKGAGAGTAAQMKKAVDFTAKHKIVPEVAFRKLDEMPQMWEELSQGKVERRQVVLFGNEKSRL